MQGIVQWSRSQPDWVLDAALAVVLLTAEIIFQFVVDPAMFPALDPFQGGTPLGIAVALVANLPIAFRRRAPIPTMVVVGLTAVAAVPLGVPYNGFALIVALYTVAAYCERRESLAVLGIFAFFTGVTLVLADAVRFAPVNAVIFLTAWVFGDRQQARRAHTEALERRAEDLEREREDKARLAVAQERARIARELHDVVAHGVSVMVVQSAGARRLLAQDPARAAEALEQIERTGRQSLVELRRVLGVLRTPEDEPSFVPQPRLEQLNALVERFLDAGLPVRVDIEGTPRQVPSGIEVSAFRIIQEALTNALRHAGPAEVLVRLCYGEADLEVEIVDNGVGAAADNGDGGQGLVGMRERAVLLGGRLDAGPLEEGGFAVRARLPTGGAA